MDQFNYYTLLASTLDEDLFDDEGERSRSRFSFSALGRRDLLRLSDGIFSMFLILSILPDYTTFS